MNDVRLLSCPFCGAQLENEPPSKIYSHPRNDCLLSLRSIEPAHFEKWNMRKPIEYAMSRLEQRVICCMSGDVVDIETVREVLNEQ